MKRFMDEDFLLHSEFAEDLYHEYAEKLPILDYHTHIPVRDIAENRVYHNLTEVLVDNPVARRLMRANGVKERFITGASSTSRSRSHGRRAIRSTRGSISCSSASLTATTCSAERRQTMSGRSARRSSQMAR